MKTNKMNSESIFPPGICQQTVTEKRERERMFHANKSELNSFTGFYRDHLFFIQFMVNVMAIHREPVLMRISCLQVVIDFQCRTCVPESLNK